MTHVKRYSPQAQAIALFDAIAAAERLAVNTKTSTRHVVKRFLELATPIPILMYGKRVEAMFAFVVASLGKCTMIREEDVGDVYSTIPVQPTDYRLVLDDGAELLVEVKNCHEARKPLRMAGEYVDRLAAYGRILNRPVKLAVYWSYWNLWTLVALSALTVARRRAELRLTDAMQVNEMATLGDHMLATTPPLAIRVVADPRFPRKATSNGEEAEFTIGGVELFCGGRKVEARLEKAIVNHFMMFGRWPQTTHVEIVGGELQWIEFLAEPEAPNVWEQGFSIVGQASSMIAKHFDFRTVSISGEIKRLRPVADPAKFGIDIPRDYRGKDVPLWRFFLQPNRRGTTGEPAG